MRLVLSVAFAVGGFGVFLFWLIPSILGQCEAHRFRLLPRFQSTGQRRWRAA